MSDAPIPMLLHCPLCSARHIDEDEFATRPHHTHACQKCGHTWRPAVVATVGVQYLPGFKNRKTGASRHEIASDLRRYGRALTMEMQQLTCVTPSLLCAAADLIEPDIEEQQRRSNLFARLKRALALHQIEDQCSGSDGFDALYELERLP